MKSSTHFSMGLNPWARRRSARASLKRPKKPPAVAHPKELEVLSANFNESTQGNQGMEISFHIDTKNLPLDSDSKRGWSHSFFGCFSECGTCTFPQTALLLGC